jgi:SAM-dependent methyltransferase
MTHVTCNICGRDETDPIAEQNSHRVVGCKNCGLVYVNPRPAPDELILLYNDYHQRGSKDARTWSSLMEKNFTGTSKLLDRMFPGGGRLLDIGCGYGHFVGQMAGLGWSAFGIDPSPSTVDYARGKGLNVSRTTIDKASFPESSFDAITAFYVLEHLFDPFSALKKIISLLRPGGVVVLRVPHTTPLVKLLGFFSIRNNLYDLPFHLYDFSPDTLRQLLEKAGFSSIRVVPGFPTLPEDCRERAVSCIAGASARFLFSVSMGRLLMPGTSKTAIAFKPGIQAKTS